MRAHIWLRGSEPRTRASPELEPLKFFRPHWDDGEMGRGDSNAKHERLLTSSSSFPSTLSSHEDTFSASSPSGLLGVYVFEM